MGRTASQKELAINQHSRQAAEFASRYATCDPFSSCFSYSRHRLRAVMDRYLPTDGHGRRLVDVGCGPGHQLQEMRDRGFQASGVDGSEEMLRHARAKSSGTDLHLADVEHLPFPDSHFDVALCIEVLRYLPDPGPCLREMARVLRPGGVCLVTAAPLFNLNGYWIVNRLALTFPVSGLVRLRQFFTTSWRVRRHVQEAGFRDVRVHGVYFGPINWVERLAPGLLPTTLRRWEPCDTSCSDRPLLRELANMFLVRGVRS